MTKFAYNTFSIAILTASISLNCSVDRTPVVSLFSESGEAVNRDFSGIESENNETYQSPTSNEGIFPSDNDSLTRENDTAMRADASHLPGDVDMNRADAGVPPDSDNNSSTPITRPNTTVGQTYNDWTYYEVEGAICRDGSAAGYYLREGSSENLLVFLNGGGICYDDFFCAINPANVEQSLSGESVIGLTVENVAQALLPERQVPADEGIFKRDPRNPVADWTMVYVPYCTGDLHGGTERDSSVITPTALPPQQFVGYTNIGLFYRSFGLDYLDAKKVLLTGASAGSLGVLFNFDRTQQFFTNSEVIAIMDSGVPFRKAYLPPCLQKKWRELWKLDAIIPTECSACFNPDGSGLSELYGYYRNKYAGRVLGGLVSTDQDEVVKLFFSAGNNNCTGNPLLAELVKLGSRGVISVYPRELYPEGLKDFIENVAGLDQSGSYVFIGETHQHLFRNRYYEFNGLNMTIAAWVMDLINGVPTHVGILP